MVRIGIDIGGTFTDLCAVDDQGRCWSTKLLTTPSNPAIGFDRILHQAFDASHESRQVKEIVHATTIATNAILEGDTARMGLITTAGFKDVLEIGRHFRRDLYNIFLEKPPVLVPRRRRLEVRERIGSDGRVIEPLCVQDVEAAIDVLLSMDVEVVLVCFLHSYANPAHELEAAQIIQNRGDIAVIASHRVCAEYREYERFSTAAVHGAVMPKVRQYIQNIQHNLRRGAVSAPLSIMQSNGGMCSASTVGEQPGLIVESGPAAGVISAAETGRRLGIDDILSFDMGGTTAKAAFVRQGRVTINKDYEVGGGIQGGFGAGYPIRTPVVDLVEIGTGGGSLARVDDVGQLHVGPQSAGASPGPACYGKGGQEPTITDANVVLGRLFPENFANGQFNLDVSAAKRAVTENVADPLQLSLEQAAEGIISLANAQMVRALQLVSAERGYDPRTATLVAFGGAGPMHAAELALELGCRQVIIPPVAGIQSAWGLLVADARRDFSRAIVNSNYDLKQLQEQYALLAREGRKELHDAGFVPEALIAKMAVDMRYVGQAYEITVEWPGEPDFSEETARKLNELFHQQHQQCYGHCDRQAKVEWVTLRASVFGPAPKPVLPEALACEESLTHRTLGQQKIFFQGQPFHASVYHRSRLGQGDQISGPALIIQSDTAITVPPSVTLTVDRNGNILLQIEDPV